MALLISNAIKETVLSTHTSESSWGSLTSWFSVPSGSDAPSPNHCQGFKCHCQDEAYYLPAPPVSEWHTTHASTHSSSPSAAPRGKLKSCRRSPRLLSPVPRDYEAPRSRLPTESVPWSVHRTPPPRAAGVGSGPALRFQLRLPEFGTCYRRWLESASATAAGPGAALPPASAASAASAAATCAPAAAQAGTGAQEAREERLAGGARLRARTW